MESNVFQIQIHSLRELSTFFYTKLSLISVENVYQTILFELHKCICYSILEKILGHLYLQIELPKFPFENGEDSMPVLTNQKADFSHVKVSMRNDKDA